MAVGLQLTLAGALLLSKAITGKQLKFTRGALGNAKVNGKVVQPTAEQMDNLNALINQKMSVPIVGYELRNNGDIAVTVRLKNETVTNEFTMREIGLFARDPDTGAEILYAYCYEYNGDKMHAKNSYVVLEYYLELITTIANATNVTCNVVTVDKIHAGIGLSRNVDTINVNVGDGISVVDNKLTAQKYALPTASPTVKGGIMIGKNLTLTGASLNAADPYTYTLPTGSATVKGGFKVGKNLYLTGDSLNSDAEPYDDSLLTSRLNQLEINLSNVFMKLDADYQLGFTANLLLVEDFIGKDTLDLGKTSILVGAKHAGIWTTSTKETSSCLLPGGYLTYVSGVRSTPVTVKNITREISPADMIISSDDRTFFIFVNEDLSEYTDGPKDADFRGGKIYRTTVAITDKHVAYGPGTTQIKTGTFPNVFKGEWETTEYNYSLNTTHGNETAFELSGEADLTRDGFFSLA